MRNRRGHRRMGPGAGHDGGRVVFEGPPAKLVDAADSLTGQHLRLHVDEAALSH